MDRDRSGATPATRELLAQGVTYTEHHYEYEEHGGTRVSSRALGVDEHAVVKTLIMEDERGDPFVVLMHGDLKVSTKDLARAAACKRIAPCKPDVAQRHSGYLVGGTSPFGTKRKMRTYMERSILDLERIYINGGRRGFLVGIDPREAVRLLSPVLVDVGIPND